MPTNGVNRRDFLRVSALGAGLAVATACTGATPSPNEPTAAPVSTASPAATATAAPATAPVSKYSEASNLADRVKAGGLPPVDERLPQEPLLVECLEEPGEYCDDLHRAGGSANFASMYLWEGLTRWDYRTGSLAVVPNIAKGWDVSADGTTFTFHLREGMRWSDGEPFTADDAMFWYNDVALNEELTPSFPGWLKVGGEPVLITRVDDYTVTFAFAQPYSLFLEYMSFTGESNPPFAPAHYLKQFHPTYADAADLEKMTKDAKFEYWYQLYANKATWGSNPEIPVLFAWTPQAEWDGQARMAAPRNPYYFKVDANGKQLPYFERLVVDAMDNSETILLKAIAGEIDLQASYMDFVNYPLLKENEERGGYRVLEWVFVCDPCIFVNQTAADPETRKLFQMPKFRYGLSHAINRDEMNELLWLNLAEPRQVMPVQADPFYKDGMGKTAIEYDVDKANALLDEVGLDKRDADGFRLRPDGARLQLLLSCYPTFELGTSAIDAFQQVAEYWRAVGIETQAKEFENSLWYERAIGNQWDMPSYTSTSFLWIVDPGCFVPTNHAYWAPAYADWNDSGGEKGEEPPEEYRRLYDWYQAMKVEPDRDKFMELGWKLLAQCDEQVYNIGLCTPSIGPMVAKKDLVNVLAVGIHDWPVHRDALTWPFQVWRRQA